MRKRIGLCIAIILLLTSMSACSRGSDKAADVGRPEDADKIRVTTTIFPVYDWVRNVAGDNEKVEISILIDSGVDLHSYQPSVEDMRKIAECDLFIYVGGESDKWVADALEGSANKDAVVLNLMDAFGDRAKEEQMVEGMQAEEHDHDDEHDHDHDDEGSEEHDHDHDDEGSEEHDHEHGSREYDEHIWLSLRNAATLVDVISEGLSGVDSDSSEIYKANASSYKEKLSKLDKEYANAIEESKVRVLLFGDRFPFRYLTDDYGLEYYACFAGCSAETEASFETIAFLSGKLDELGLKNIITIEGTDHSIAESIIRNSEAKDQRILTLDSMQAITAADIDAGASYLSIMEANLDVIKEALS